ncbi:MAG: PQQ-binding-like beta-propeller repeat protein [Pirellulaceae bacterium]|nr:PQQ-binding-like beta-propeller repeat protein [Pirellulaceae bacterium]
MRNIATAFSIMLSISAALQGAESGERSRTNWPQWRGPIHNGVAPLGDPPIRWSKTENLQWKSPIAGRGHSTPIIWDDQIFLVTAIPIKKSLSPSYRVPAGTPRISEHDAVITKWTPQALVLICLDRQTGQERWQRTTQEVMPHQGYHWKGSFASASPVTNGQHVYVSFGSYGLFCFDMKGQLAWKRQLGPQAMEDSLGEGSSPALFGNTLVIVVDHELQSFILAIDSRTGKTLWKQKRNEVSNWSTPRIFEHAGIDQVIVNGEYVRSYDLANGNLLWQCGGQSEGAIPIPAVGHGMVFATSGYAKDTFHAIRLGRQGDLTDSEHVIWSLNRGTPYVPSPMLWKNEIYLLEDRSFFSCLHATDGTQHYLKHRLPGVLNFSASPVGAADRIYLLSEEGTTVVLKRGIDPEVLSINQIDETFYASPAIVGDSIFLRGDKHLYRFSKSASQPR